MTAMEKLEQALKAKRLEMYGTANVDWYGRLLVTKEQKEFCSKIEKQATDRILF